MLRIAHVASFPDDRREAAAQAAQSSEVDVLLSAYLSDAVLCDLARVERQHAAAGFVSQFLESLADACPALYLQPQLKWLTSAGGLDPRGLAELAASTLCERGCPDLRLAVVQGDDLLERLEELMLAGCALDDQRQAARFRDLTVVPVYAHAWLGAGGIVEALDEGARLVITGCVTAPTLGIAAAVHHFGWSGQVFSRLAATAGVGNCFTSGSDTLRALARPATGNGLVSNPGTLIAGINSTGLVGLEQSADGVGQLSEVAVRRDVQSRTAHADVTIDTKRIEIHSVANGLRIDHVQGGPPADCLAVSIGLLEGYEALCVLPPADERTSLEPAEVVEVLTQRLAQRGERCDELICQRQPLGWLLLKAYSHEPGVLERFAHHVAWLRQVAFTSPDVSPLAQTLIRPRYTLWQTDVPKQLVEASVDCRPAREWV